jgi:hypothetical protein
MTRCERFHRSRRGFKHERKTEKLKVRLLHNLIDEKGQYHSRNEIIDDSTLPKHIKNNPQLISRELDKNAGLALALYQLTFSMPTKQADGRTVWYPKSIGVGDTFKLSDLDERQRENLKEGVHYRLNFSDDDAAKVRYEFQKGEDEAIFGKSGSIVGYGS